MQHTQQQEEKNSCIKDPVEEALHRGMHGFFILSGGNKNRNSFHCRAASDKGAVPVTI